MFVCVYSTHSYFTGHFAVYIWPCGCPLSVLSKQNFFTCWQHWKLVTQWLTFQQTCHPVVDILPFDKAFLSCRIHEWSVTAVSQHCVLATWHGIYVCLSGHWWWQTRLSWHTVGWLAGLSWHTVAWHAGCVESDRHVCVCNVGWRCHCWHCYYMCFRWWCQWFSSNESRLTCQLRLLDSLSHDSVTDGLMTLAAKHTADVVLVMMMMMMMMMMIEDCWYGVIKCIFRHCTEL